MNTMETIAARYTCRSYVRRQICDSDLMRIISAANAAPYAGPHGAPPFSNVRLSVVQDPGLLEKIDAAQPGVFPTHGAPTVIVVSCAGDEADLALANAICIAENMFLAAADLELGGALLFGVVRDVRKDELLCRELGIPQGFAPYAMLAVGYSAQPIPVRRLTTEKIAYVRLPAPEQDR